MASTISAGVTSGTALNIQSDTSGNLAFKTGSANVTAMTLDSDQNVSFANAVTYSGNIQGAVITATTNFAGSGSALTTLNASNISSGTLSTAVLPTTGVNASTITAGTLAVANGGTGTATPSIVAGSGVSVTGTWPNQTVAATGGGTVTSVATGNGLSGGTITSTGTLVVACPTFNTVGSYCFVGSPGNGGWTWNSGSNYSAGSGAGQFQSCTMYTVGGSSGEQKTNNLSGTWKWMSGTTNTGWGTDATMGIACRVS